MTYAIWDKQAKTWLTPDYNTVDEGNEALIQFVMQSGDIDRYTLRNKDYPPSV